MANVLFFLVSSAFAIALATSNALPGERQNIQKEYWNATGNSSGGFQSNAPFRIGVVDGITFWGDRTTRRNWAQAKFFCESMDRRLASIETQEEQDMLNAAFSAGSFDGDFWTSGKDAREFRQFTWESGVEPTDLYTGQFDFFGVDITTERCLTYQSRPTGLVSHLNCYQCTQQHFVLCIEGVRP